MNPKLILLFYLTLLPTACSLQNYNPISPMDEHTKNGLSVFYIHPKPISKDFYTPTTVIYRGEIYAAEAKIRGGVTALYPKKSYTIRFPDDHLFSDPYVDPANGVFENRKKIVLISNFDDNSHLRNRLAYFMWNQMNNNYKIDSSAQKFMQTEHLKGSILLSIL